MGKMRVFCQIDGMDGECTEKDHKNWCEVLAFNQKIIYPFSRGEYTGTGEPEHHGLTITKPMDSATPLLMAAGAKKSKVKEVTIEFTRDDPKSDEGGTQVYFIIKLEDVRVISIEPSSPLELDPGERFPHREDVTFAYRKVIWKHDPASQETQYDFDQPSG
jgi:type VI secretion system secreted protein Hcp